MISFAGRREDVDDDEEDDDDEEEEEEDDEDEVSWGLWCFQFLRSLRALISSSSFFTIGSNCERNRFVSLVMFLKEVRASLMRGKGS